MSLNLATQPRTKSSTLIGAGLAGAIGLAVLTVGVGGYWLWSRTSDAVGSSETGRNLYTVVPRTLDVVVKQKGELQAVDNIELISKVEGRTTITSIVKEGTYVNKNEIVVQLDSSAIRQQIDDLSLEIQRQEASVANAREMLAIQQSNNAAELEGAQVSLQLAEVDLQKYVEGTYPQESKSATTKLQMARIDLANKQDDLAQAKSLFTRGFVTAADVKKAELAVTQATNAVAEAETALRVLQEYTHRADMAAKQNAVAQARSKLERVRRQNESTLIQKRADLNSAEQQLQMRQRRMDLLQDQFEACTIRAPEDGMVVYSNNPDNQAVVQEGAEVRERQPIVRLPDTRNMKSVLKLNESQANRVEPGMRASIVITGVPEPLSGTVSKVSIVPISGNRWTNPDSKDYPAEVTLDFTPPNLKPSTSAETVISVRRVENALAVPLESIYGLGNKAFVFVAQGERFEPREVKVGDSDDKQVALTAGITAGERVLILEAGQGKRLLEEAGVKVEMPTSRGGPMGGGGNPAASSANGAASNGAPPAAANGRGDAPRDGNGESRRRRGDDANVSPRDGTAPRDANIAPRDSNSAPRDGNTAPGNRPVQATPTPTH